MSIIDIGIIRSNQKNFTSAGMTVQIDKSLNDDRKWYPINNAMIPVKNSITG
jgi:hypothetical protein